MYCVALNPYIKNFTAIFYMPPHAVWAPVVAVFPDARGTAFSNEK